MGKYLTQSEQYLFKEGTWQEAYLRFGAQPAIKNDKQGYVFSVWAPHAKAVYVTGDFCDWQAFHYPMKCDASQGIFSLFIADVKEGQCYKYVIESEGGELFYKADPYANYAQQPPETASRLFDLSKYHWKDKKWLTKRHKTNHMEQALNIYEVQLGSWKRNEDGSYYSYEQLKKTLIPYVKEMGYTHLELMPVMEYPYDGSWGYQITGYYAPTSRFGNPCDFMGFIDACHQAGIGVILDWVPGHFCQDSHGLAMFDGTKLYEKEKHAQWGTLKFDFSKGEVRSFLLSNAMFWLKEFHVDGLRVDGVTSMLYLNFGIDNPKLKKFNEKGTEEDFESIQFIQNLNAVIGKKMPDVMMIAEESTAWPLVTYPPKDNGLGFHYKWDMGWMHDTLHYMQTDFPYRPGNHHLLTFSMMYNFNENFVLALSHDEVVHGKCSLIGRMPGDWWRQFAGMRALAFYQITHPGAKHNFMGNEFAQFIEWREYEGLEWFLLEYDTHRHLQDFNRDLNHFFLSSKALWQKNYSWEGFAWSDADNKDQSTIIYRRKGKQNKDEQIILINFVPEVYDEFRIGVPKKAWYKEVFNTDAKEYGGSGRINEGYYKAEKLAMHGQPYSICVKTPPIGGMVFERVGPKEVKEKIAKK
ncbi:MULTISPECIES: 1,4-alpha-glucan branching protein GlgB [Terrabacteria group]|uniref:1,4-alpha-glucan branching protein GlgB n=1 Tax=Bacillati TaxID=1783272 RepID=UPI001C6F2797|nr:MULTISPECIES: 1,4-alpha-glucan branching protein GlgB [Terrabacteria group]MBW9211996.1 1,4-alpha-glucan branching protein GlgB [Trueperella sp. zg.1013]